MATSRHSGGRRTRGKLESHTITRGPRKGTRVLVYRYPSGKWTEVKRGRGATKQRRAAARKAGLKDRFGRTAEDRARIRKKNPKKARAFQVRKARRGLSRQGKLAAELISTQLTPGKTRKKKGGSPAKRKRRRRSQ